MQFFAGDDVGREYIDYIPQGPQQNAVIDKKTVQLAADAG